MPFCRPRKTHPTRVFWEIIKRSDYFILQRNRSEGTRFKPVVGGIRKMWQTHVHSFRIIIAKSPYQVICVSDLVNEITEDWMWLERYLSPVVMTMSSPAAFQYIVYFFVQLASLQEDPEHSLTPRDSITPSAMMPPSPSLPTVSHSNSSEDLYMRSSISKEKENEYSKTVPSLSIMKSGDFTTMMRNSVESKGEVLSRKFFKDRKLDFDEEIIDGFFIVFSDTHMRFLPSFNHLQTVEPKINLEVVVVDRRVDVQLVDTITRITGRVEGVGPGAMFDSLSKVSKIQRLGAFVADMLGGSGSFSSITDACTENIDRIRQQEQSNVIPLGRLRVGVSRHRALLFRVLCDSIGIESRLLSGVFSQMDEIPGNLEIDDTITSTTGVAPEVSKMLWNVITLTRRESFEAGFNISQDTAEVIVNLMKAPGQLIPLDSSLKPQLTMRYSPIPVRPTVENVRDKGTAIQIQCAKPEEGRQKWNPLRRRKRNGYSDGPAVRFIQPPTPQSAPSRQRFFSADEETTTTITTPAINRATTEVEIKIIKPAGTKTVSSDRQEKQNMFSNDRKIKPQRIHIRRSSEPALAVEEPTDSMPESRRSFERHGLEVRVMSKYEIQYKDLEFGPKIGAGSFGEVFKGKWKKTDVAIKRLYKREDLDELFLEESEILCQLTHPNVVLFLGICVEPVMCFVTEFVSQGTLWRVLQKKTIKIDANRRIQMALDVARGMHYLHTHDPCIIHRDLKTPNLLVCRDWHVKVCDFGLARIKRHAYIEVPTDAGSPRYMAPEVLRGDRFNEKSDVYSFGVCLWEMVTRMEPWPGLSAMEVVGAVGFQNRHLDIPECSPVELSELMNACLHSDPEERPSFGDICDSLESMIGLLRRQTA